MPENVRCNRALALVCISTDKHSSVEILAIRSSVPFNCNYTTCNFAGQHNDARMNLALGLTAVRHGASVANHVEVLSLLKKKGTSLCSGMWKTDAHGGFSLFVLNKNSRKFSLKLRFN